MSFYLHKSIEALRNLRELYVAVTRAKKRVVILYRDKTDSNFFLNLQCGVETTAASVALLDFNRTTSDADWYAEGRKYFDDENYQLAEVSSVLASFSLCCDQQFLI